MFLPLLRQHSGDSPTCSRLSGPLWADGVLMSATFPRADLAGVREFIVSLNSLLFDVAAPEMEGWLQIQSAGLGSSQGTNQLKRDLFACLSAALVQELAASLPAGASSPKRQGTAAKWQRCLCIYTMIILGVCELRLLQMNSKCG